MTEISNSWACACRCTSPTRVLPQALLPLCAAELLATVASAAQPQPACRSHRQQHARWHLALELESVKRLLPLPGRPRVAHPGETLSLAQILFAREPSQIGRREDGLLPLALLQTQAGTGDRTVDHHFVAVQRPQQRIGSCWARKRCLRGSAHGGEWEQVSCVG